MRRLLIWFGLVALFAAPALADITLRYNVRGQAAKQIVLSATGDGRARLDSGDGGVLIARDGTGYFISRDAQGEFVGRQEDALAIMTAFMAAIVAMIPDEPQGQMAGFRAMAEAPYEVRAGARETVGGREGVVHTIAPAAGGQGPTLEIVLASDADLEPVGRELRRLIGMAHGPAATILGQSPDILRELEALFARGVPIRIGDQFTLASASADPLPESAFALPGPVLSLEALQGRMQLMAMPMPAPSAGASGEDELVAEGDDE
jgi:hypothetical protein